MHGIEHRVINRDGNVASGQTLPMTFENKEAAEAHIQELQKQFALYGFDEQYDCWWARNSGENLRLHRWWIS
jgi:hypothetical protein